jgi:hypothetical protein
MNAFLIISVIVLLWLSLGSIGDQWDAVKTKGHHKE